MSRGRLQIRAEFGLAAWIWTAFHFGLACCSSAAEPPLLIQARRAFEESLPQLTISKLRRHLTDPQFDAKARAEATRLLAEAYIQLGQVEDARTVLAPLVANGDVQARLLRAHAFARSGAWVEARDAYTDLLALPNPSLAARIGAAESWHALGETGKAVALLEGIGRTGDANVAVQLRLAGLYVETGQLAQSRSVLTVARPSSTGEKLWERYVEGRILLREDQPDAAGAAFAEVLSSPTDLTENLAAAATVGMAEVKLMKQGPDTADKVLETFIWNNPESPWLEMAFRRLDQVYAAQRKPEEDQLQKWATHTRLTRAALARFYLAKMQSRARKWDKALGALDIFLARYPAHRFASSAHLMRADVLGQKGRWEDATAALEAASRTAESPAARAEIDLPIGLAHLRQGEFLLAAISLKRAAEASENLREVATYNAALAWLGQGNMEQFRVEYGLLIDMGTDSELRGNLALEAVLTAARNGDENAERGLHRFIEEFPTHPRVREARVSLAELKFVGRNFDEATRLLHVAAPRTSAKPLDDQAACLAIFLSDSKEPRDQQETIRLATDFVKNRPKSPLLPDVRMKLGQIYFRQSDYPNAAEQFGNLAKESPDGPSAESALFLAGQSVMRTAFRSPESTEQALAYFDDVVKRNGHLKLYAREQQAIMQVRLGREQEAVALYDLIIDSRQPIPDAELRNAALIGKGEALAMLGRKDPSQVVAAIAVYDQLATSADVAASWRHQALYRKAKLLSDQPGRKGDALALYNDILDLNLDSPEKEYFWFYKAGFEAARLLQQQQQWPEAIAVYEKMARLNGPHSSEAREIARRMRNEHFVWD